MNITKDNEYKEKFLVCKWDNVYKELTDEEYAIFGILVSKINKQDKHYLVVNQNEPYAKEVWELIKKGINNAR